MSFDKKSIAITDAHEDIVCHILKKIILYPNYLKSFNKTTLDPFMTAGIKYFKQNDTVFFCFLGFFAFAINIVFYNVQRKDEFIKNLRKYNLK